MVLMGEFGLMREVLMVEYKFTHPSVNLDPFWTEPLPSITFEFEAKSGKVATSRCTHPIASRNKDTCPGTETGHGI